VQVGNTGCGLSLQMSGPEAVAIAGTGVFVGGGGFVLVGGAEVVVGAAVGGPGVAVRVAVGAAGLAVPGRAVVGVGPGEVALPVTAVVADGSTGRRMTSVLPKVADGPKVAVRVGEGVAVGGKGLSPGARVRVGAGGDVGKNNPKGRGVGVPAGPPRSTIASTAGSFTDVPLAAKVWTTAT